MEGGLPGASLRFDDNLDQLFRMDNVTGGYETCKTDKEATMPP